MRGAALPRALLRGRGGAVVPCRRAGSLPALRRGMGMGGGRRHAGPVPRLRAMGRRGGCAPRKKKKKKKK